MKFPWKKALDAARLVRAAITENPKLFYCPEHGVRLQDQADGSQWCPRGHYFRPANPAGNPGATLPNQGDHHGKL